MSKTGLILKRYDSTSPLIAKEAVTVYKHGFFCSDDFTSSFYMKSYRVNAPNEPIAIKAVPQDDYPSYIVEQGYHSHLEMQTCINEAFFRDRVCVIGEFTVPADSECFINYNCTKLVSSHITFTGKVARIFSNHNSKIIGNWHQLLPEHEGFELWDSRTRDENIKWLFSPKVREYRKLRNEVVNKILNERNEHAISEFLRRSRYR